MIVSLFAKLVITSIQQIFGGPDCVVNMFKILNTYSCI